MLPYLIDWLSLFGRWLHFIVGIAWIGSSFYFVWLDNHLLPPKDSNDDDKGVGGEVWSVHGGGFYHAQKYRVAPQTLPEPLHWFKWEAYTTWLSGIFLLGLVYWYSAEIYLIDPQIQTLTSWQAIGIAVGFIVGGWVVYDLMCKSKIGNHDLTLAVALLVLVTLLAWSLTHLFSGRGAFIHFGAVLGTIMVANVFFVIIPGQKIMVAAASRGEAPDPSHGIKGKQRSVHNTYFTLPVLFVMISNHYAMTYTHAYNWLILVAISVAGALIRVYFVARHKGTASTIPLIVAGLLFAIAAAAMLPERRAASESEVTIGEIRNIVIDRCITCHSMTPTFTAYASAPAGVMLESDDQIIGAAQRIYEQTVVSRVMPIGNLTQITEDERAKIGSWYAGLTDTKQFSIKATTPLTSEDT